MVTNHKVFKIFKTLKSVYGDGGNPLTPPPRLRQAQPPVPELVEGKTRILKPNTGDVNA
jgi:hypothetical protein